MKTITRLAVLTAVSLSLASLPGILAQTDLPHPESTWSLNPTSGDWNLAENWMPQSVPDTQAERAVFVSSSITDISTTGTVIHSVTFDAGASQYTLNGFFGFNGGGVINNSGVVQTFKGSFGFTKGAIGGSLTTFECSGGYFADTSSGGNATFINSGFIDFFRFPTAGNATFINNGGATDGAPGSVIYFEKADAGSATIINNGGAVFGAEGGLVKFRKAGAASSTIISNGGAVFGAHGAQVTFHKAYGNTATLIANGGAGPGSGASIIFTEDSSGDLARVEVFGNGNLDVSRPREASDVVGSIEGNGLVFLGASNLNVGGNNLNTTFAGVISDVGGLNHGTGGSLTKTGTGTMTLSNANSYTGGTTVQDGSILVNNTSGSGTGSGAVQDNSGTLGGSGTIGGAVTIGSGSGSGAILLPGGSAGNIGALNIQGALTYNSDGTSEVELDSTTVSADEILADGVTINSGAQLSLADLGSSSLNAGTSFTVISNTAASAIAGTFVNLPDNGTVTIGSNTFQANYEGGDGNDLTLTVLP